MYIYIYTATRSRTTTMFRLTPNPKVLTKFLGGDEQFVPFCALIQ